MPAIPTTPGATDADAPVAYVRSEPRAQSLIASFRELIATADYAEGED